uniref:Uncharacterized protein n=1 Tax=Chlorocebus sabaeus TaxID=60711 RepID=A0A0D9RYD2_CHLSB
PSASGNRQHRRRERPPPPRLLSRVFSVTSLRAGPGDISLVLPPRLVGPTDGRSQRGPDCGTRPAHREWCS